MVPGASCSAGCAYSVRVVGSHTTRSTPVRWPRAPCSVIRSAAVAGSTAPVHLVGHSYGGAVALQFALRWPGRVASLTLYEPARFALLTAAGAAGAAEAARAADARHEITTIANRFGLAVVSGRLHEAAELFADYCAASQIDDRRLNRLFDELHDDLTSGRA